MRDDLDGPSISCEPFGSPETSVDGRQLHRLTIVNGLRRSHLQ